MMAIYKSTVLDHKGNRLVFKCGQQPFLEASILIYIHEDGCSCPISALFSLPIFCQVLLYDETRRFLESRFLKMDEIIKSGESIAFDGHLVDIGELNKDDKLPMDFKVEGRISKMVGKTEGAGGKIHLHGQLPVGMPSLPICFRLSFWSSIFFSFCHLSQGLTCFPGHTRTKFTQP